MNYELNCVCYVYKYVCIYVCTYVCTYVCIYNAVECIYNDIECSPVELHSYYIPISLSRMKQLKFDPEREPELQLQKQKLEKEVRELDGMTENLRARLSHTDFATQYTRPHRNFNDSAVKRIISQNNSTCLGWFDVPIRPPPGGRRCGQCHGKQNRRITV